MDVAGDCKFCTEKGTGCYTCPRCNARYCSVDCYKTEAHLSCSELFYRDCFMDGLRSMQPDSSECRKLTDMLRRLELDVDLDDGGTDDLVERFADVDVDSSTTDVIWQRLTDCERVEFERLLSSGEASNLVDLWTPWWCAASPVLVEEAGKESTKSDNILPPVRANIPQIEQLAKCGISDLIPFSIVNVLYGYAYTARLYNGDHLALATESAAVMLAVSDSLGQGVFSDVPLAIGGCLSRLRGSEAHVHFISSEYCVSVVDDVRRIVVGAQRSPVPFPLVALSDCHHVFHTAHKGMRHEQKTSGSGDQAKDPERRRYFAVEKKLEYFLSWFLSYGDRLLELLPAVELECCELTTQLTVHLAEQTCVEEIIKQKKSDTKPIALIEEISSS